MNSHHLIRAPDGNSLSLNIHRGECRISVESSGALSTPLEILKGIDVVAVYVHGRNDMLMSVRSGKLFGVDHVKVHRSWVNAYYSGRIP